MAKSGHTFAKRKREQEKKARAAAKRARRQVRKHGPDLASSLNPGALPVFDPPVDVL